MRRRAAFLAAALSAALLASPVAAASAAPAPAAATVLRTTVTPDPSWKSVTSTYLTKVLSGTQGASKKAGAKPLAKDVAGTAALMRAYAKKDTAYLAKQPASFKITVKLKKRTPAEAQALEASTLAAMKSSGALKKFFSKRLSKLSLVVYTRFDASGKPTALTLWMSAR